eukprot:TRINITY_DN15353_c0_g1::TRINITY_DN15353_c0_g1_i1::g.22700::m.22700 TRINITY_DN15353_c0_g1::TRINITY_DN15353_c0_g1_i1::g.22700  ORF type:complete len:179 (-),score=11.73,sp/Q7RVM2/ARF_NEUCR/53.53/5e-61,Arf/PF00025.16/1.5e-53,G-alpha/PF00503.15/0.22,G-alpha/PF00503.15/7.6e-07,Miro/PF08477.8/6.5e-08,SRPRB/PF09439.5/8e-07,Ras/PF00071.17/3.3e-06,ABC_tran/PF00005.22/0.00016,Gtr1_RagA/PF04670.7/0.00024,MMR_HSR1/PF01926.18/0.0021,NACHT/PF05729.7/58,NACHT/PF05729.7/0.012,GTP_EFTU/PF00009.22/42,GTP_EFTU/PF00
MGNSFANLFKTREYRILMIGLTGAGKSTIVYKLHIGDVPTTPGCIGFNVETTQYKNIHITSFEVGISQHNCKILWSHYFQDSDAVVFVVDSTDRDQLEEARTELHEILSHELLKNVSLLVLANKQDLPDAIPPAEMVTELALGKLGDRKWHVEGSCAVTGDGIFEGLDWLSFVNWSQK